MYTLLLLHTDTVFINTNVCKTVDLSSKSTLSNSHVEMISRSFVHLDTTVSDDKHCIVGQLYVSRTNWIELN